MTQKRHWLGRLLVAATLLVPLASIGPASAEIPFPNFGVGEVLLFEWCPWDHHLFAGNCVEEPGTLVMQREIDGVVFFILKTELGVAAGHFPCFGDCGTAELAGATYDLDEISGSLPAILGVCALSLSFSGTGAGFETIGGSGTAFGAICTDNLEP